MSVLTHDQIVCHIKSGQLICSPLMDWRQVGESSLDFRVGTHFILFKISLRPCLDVLERGATGSPLDFQEKVHVGIGGRLILAPGMVVLAATLEFFSIPPFLACEVITRSSWGRLGLVIATATWVHPLFRGCLTLEIVNHSRSAVALYPGTKIGQLVFHEAAPPACIPRLEKLKQGMTRPEYSKLFSQPPDAFVSGFQLQPWHEPGGTTGG